MTVCFKLYSRSGCHLCDEMVRNLMSLDLADTFTVQIFDIDTDPVIQRQYALRIPVLTVSENDQIICEQVFDPQAVMHYLATRAG